MISILKVEAKPDWSLLIEFVDGPKGIFDVSPYLSDGAFEDLKNISEFMKIHNRGYFVEWECGADLSADTLRAKIKAIQSIDSPFNVKGIKLNLSSHDIVKTIRESRKR